MLSEESKGWIEAAKILAEDPDKKIICPKCNVGYLFTKDVLWEDGKKCDRYFICSYCNAYNTATFFID